MKGCPLSNFGPCKENECLFCMQAEGQYNGCIIINHYIISLLNSGRLLDLTSGLAGELPQLYSGLSGDDLRSHVDDALARLEYMRDLLKDLP
ncbi:MAG: hypothetical protein KGZ88_09515 [Methylomicrobium sp.]|nr:hypothetical protein [Methylomicrobium sp.]